MKNELTQTHAHQSLPLIKLLSLATVGWGVLGHTWFDMLGAAWLVWLVFGLLLLLDAGAAGTRPAEWNHVGAMLGRILGPSILPFYAALGLLLAVGPSYVRQTPVFTLPPKGSSMPNRFNETSGFKPTASSLPRPGSPNAPSFSSTPPRPFSRPNIPQGPAAPNAQPQVGRPPAPVATPTAPKPASPAPVSPPSAPAAPTTFSKPAPIQPSGSARPATSAPK